MQLLFWFWFFSAGEQSSRQPRRTNQEEVCSLKDGLARGFLEGHHMHKKEVGVFGA